MTEVTETEDPAEHVSDPDEAARGAFYGLFAALFDEPDEAVYEALAHDEVVAQAELLADATALDLSVPDRLPVADEHDLLQARFNDVFEVGYPDPPVALYESEYRDTETWHDVNLDLARAYDYFGLSVNETEREHHDHLRLELEFAGYLSRRAATGENGARRARLDFLDRHLSVLTEGVREAIADEPNTGPYGPLAELLDEFVTADRDALEAELADDSATESAGDPDAELEGTTP